MLMTQAMNVQKQAKGLLKSKLGMADEFTVLSKLEIKYKDEKGKENFYVFQYNPNQLSIEKKVTWVSADGSKQDAPEKEFLTGEGKSLTIKDILFDTTTIGTVSSDSKDLSVYTHYIEALESLTIPVDFGGKTANGKKFEIKHPPILELSWGKSSGESSYFFECYISNIDYKFEMFNKEGTPTRAKVDLTFEEIATKDTKKKKRKVQKQAKEYTVSFGDTLHTIAAKKYKDTNKWKIIATANGIEDPMYVPVGTKLKLPVVG